MRIKIIVCYVGTSDIAFYVGTSDSNSGPCFSAASSLLTVPSPLPLKVLSNGWEGLLL